MKKINLYPVIVLIIAIVSCGKNNRMLIDQLPAEFIVNPETGVLLKEDDLVNVQFDGAEIKGFTKKNTFRTTDFFQSFTHQPYSLPLQNNYFDTEGNNIVSSYLAWNNPSPITYSTDYGNSWHTFTPDIPGYSSIGFQGVMLMDTKIFDDNTMLLVTFWSEYTTNGPNNYAWMYSINLNTGVAQLISKIEGYMPEAVHFINRNKGWMLLNKLVQAPGGGVTNRNAYIAVTEDGGLTWSTPVLVELNEPMKLAGSKQGHLFLYNGYGTAWFSANGTTWTRSDNTTFKFFDVSIVNANVLYAVSDQGIIKSTNGGKNWEFVPKADYYQSGKVSFISEQEGIIYGNRTLYHTTDGGANWKTLLFPYPYVMD